ncbi:MAG TPA: hypothetical protein DCQ06_06775 [Myxococcales bacterium]|nr:hypothetical protein [Myxococcales bacterium]HAN31287.1 hypothetical protein [Myxococcales bacterium]
MKAVFSHVRALDWLLGAVLAFGAFWVLMATMDMGFVRDEAFYFRHAETYQDWFVDVEAGGERREKALTRDQILKVWRNNFEHPPLNKILFGYSWRWFGRKLRPVSGLATVGGRQGEAPQIKAMVHSLSKSQGFAKGARVTLLGPQAVGSSASPSGRELASGEITRRDAWSAQLMLDHGADFKALKATCQPAGPVSNSSTILRTGCEVIEEKTVAIWSESQSMRAPGAMAAALLVLLVWLAARGFMSGGRPWMSRPFAALAASGFLLIPRAFYHSHLACFDITIVTLLVATTLCYHRSLYHRAWVLPTALLWGLSLLTKHNALFFPVALIGHWFWDGVVTKTLTCHLRSPAAWGASPRLGTLVGWLALIAAMSWVHPLLGGLVMLLALSRWMQVQLPPLPLAWFAMIPIGLVILVVGWPLLWVDTLDNLLNWIEFHLRHEHYMQEYFGQILAYPPFPISLPWVLTALTVPLTLLVTLVYGLAAAIALELGLVKTLAAQLDREQRGSLRLWLLSALWPLALIALPSTPVFGGTKHWFLAYPFGMLLGGWALCRAFSLTPSLRRRPWLAAAAAFVIALPAAQATWDVHPHGTAYYNSLIGGVPGAARAGLQRQFWGGATRDGLAVVNRRASHRSRVWFHNCAWGAFNMYQREGWFRRDLRYHSTPMGSELGFYHHQRDHDDYEVDCINDYGSAAPIFQVDIEGVPMLSVYQRPDSQSAGQH